MGSALYPWLAVLAHVGVFVVIAFRLVMRKPAAGVALSWLLLVATVPLVGVAFYLLAGERRIGQRRANRIARIRTDYAALADRIVDESIATIDWSKHAPAAESMHRLGLKLTGAPTVSGSGGRLFADSAEILEQIAEDIRNARTSVVLESYIWSEGGHADTVAEALAEAARRGVACRVLVDAIGGARWLGSSQARRLRDAGVRVLPALPPSLAQALFSRNDLRLHRKVIVVDGRVAWTGSINMADPRFFKQNSRAAPWVDAMLRVEGGAVGALLMTVVGDWILESGEPLEEVLDSVGEIRVRAAGDSDVQVIPSGPAQSADGLLQMLLTLIASASEELVMTTPYFVPDESLMRAIRGAASRGVDVRLVVPETIDSVLTHYASRSYLDELMDVGVRVHQFRGGLLHTKSVTADRSISMFGTVNLDMRSIWLNYEVSLFVYGERFGRELRELQQRYLGQSHELDRAEWAGRPLREKLLENTLRLMSPLL